MVAMDAMDTSPSSPVWAQDVDVFTSPDRNTTEAGTAKRFRCDRGDAQRR